MKRFCIAWIICVLITVARDIEPLTKPTLFLEDGAAIWSYYYNWPSIIPPIRHYGGYVAILSDIIGYSTSYFPTRWHPHMFSAGAILISSAAFALFASSPFRKVVENDNQRLAVAVGLAILPLGSFAKASVVSFSQWPAGAALCLLTALAPRLGPELVVLMTILVWANPFSVLLLPFFAWEAWRRRGDSRDALGWGVLVIATIAYIWIGRTFDPTNPHIYKGLMDGTRLILERGIAETAIGTGARMWIISHWHWVALDALGVAILGLMIFALRDRLRDPVFLSFSLKLAIIGCAVCYLSAMVRDGIGLDTAVGRRYAFTLSIGVAVLLLIAVTDAIMANRPVLQRAALAAVVVAAAGALNYQNNGFYKNPSNYWPRLRAFLKEVIAAEKAGVTQTLVLEEPDRTGWSIPINVRPRR